MAILEVGSYLECFLLIFFTSHFYSMNYLPATEKERFDRIDDLYSLTNNQLFRIFDPSHFISENLEIDLDELSVGSTESPEEPIAIKSSLHTDGTPFSFPADYVSSSRALVYNLLTKTDLSTVPLTLSQTASRKEHLAYMTMAKMKDLKSTHYKNTLTALNLAREASVLSSGANIHSSLKLSRNSRENMPLKPFIFDSETLLDNIYSYVINSANQSEIENRSLNLMRRWYLSLFLSKNRYINRFKYLVNSLSVSQGCIAVHRSRAESLMQLLRMKSLKGAIFTDPTSYSFWETQCNYSIYTDNYVCINESNITDYSIVIYDISKGQSTTNLFDPVTKKRVCPRHFVDYPGKKRILIYDGEFADNENEIVKFLLSDFTYFPQNFSIFNSESRNSNVMQLILAQSVFSRTPTINKLIIKHASINRQLCVSSVSSPRICLHIDDQHEIYNHFYFRAPERPAELMLIRDVNISLSKYIKTDTKALKADLIEVLKDPRIDMVLSSMLDTFNMHHYSSLLIAGPQNCFTFNEVFELFVRQLVYTIQREFPISAFENDVVNLHDAMHLMVLDSTKEALSRHKLDIRLLKYQLNNFLHNYKESDYHEDDTDSFNLNRHIDTDALIICDNLYLQYLRNYNYDPISLGSFISNLSKFTTSKAEIYFFGPLSTRFMHSNLWRSHPLCEKSSDKSHKNQKPQIVSISIKIDRPILFISPKFQIVSEIIDIINNRFPVFNEFEVSRTRTANITYETVCNLNLLRRKDVLIFSDTYTGHCGHAYIEAVSDLEPSTCTGCIGIFFLQSPTHHDNLYLLDNMKNDIYFDSVIII